MRARLLVQAALLTLLAPFTTAGCAPAEPAAEVVASTPDVAEPSSSDVLLDVEPAVEDGSDVTLLDVTDASTGDTLPPIDDALDGEETSDSADDADLETCIEGTGCILEKPSTCDVGICDALGICQPTPILGCCENNDDCQVPEILVLLGACEARLCDQFECTTVTKPGCCETDAACEPTDACGETSCNLDTLHCQLCPSDCLCKDKGPIFTEDFNVTKLSYAGFSTYKPYWGTITWESTDARWARPPKSAYLGRLDCLTYYDGAMSTACEPLDPTMADSNAVQATLKSPFILLPADSAGHVAIFWVWAEVQPFAGLGAGEPDVLTVLVEDTGLGATGTWAVARSTDVGKTTDGEWRPIAVDLHPWAGHNIRLHFDFDTLDGKDNLYEGVYVDELQVVDRCIEGCCTQDSDCLQDDDPCTEARCLTMSQGAGQVCANLYANPGHPCETCDDSMDCDDDNPCTEDICSPQGLCSHHEFCCLETPHWTDGFENGLLAWSLSGGSGSNDVQWQIITTPDSAEGVKTAWFGDVASGTYSADTPVAGGLTTEAITLPPAETSSANLSLRFRLKLSTEWDGQTYMNPEGIDRLTVEVVQTGASTEIWSSDTIGGSTDGEWLEITLDLGPWASELIFLRWHFDSVDAVANAYGGVHIDDVRVGTLCP